MELEEAKGATLPYRAGPEELSRVVEARARGRNPEEIQNLGFSRKGFDGAMLAGQVLGFLGGENAALTDLGRSFALADDAGRRTILRSAMLRYSPYGLLLEAVLGRGAATTDLSWIETWWATVGLGASQNNRSEASSSFARMADFAGFGTYIQGRRGHSSRLEWTDELRSYVQPRSSGTAIGSEAPPAAAARVGALTATVPGTPRTGDNGASESRPPQAPVESDRIEIRLREGRKAVLIVPPPLTADEKERIKGYIDLIIEPEEHKKDVVPPRKEEEAQ